MGMLIQGIWDNNADQSMQDGAYQRETSPLPTRIDSTILERLERKPSEFALIASSSCPWSHGAVLTSVLKGFNERLPIHLAGGPRVEGYTLLPSGPLAATPELKHIHQLYTRTNATFTGRATVPILWDLIHAKIISNSSADIMRAFNTSGNGLDLSPIAQRATIEALTISIFDGLSNAVYRAGKAQRQDEYQEAVENVYKTMNMLEQRLSDRAFLFGSSITEADIRLFATLVRFDTVYAHALQMHPKAVG